MPKKQGKVSNQQILEAINGLGTRVGALEKTTVENNQLILKSINDFSTEIDKKVSKIDTRLTTVEFKVTTIGSEMTEMRSEMTSIRSQMVTKSYLDDKLADLQADLAVDKKIKTLTNILHHKQVITQNEVNIVFSV